ncbi:MAG: VWA domain-containing protein [Myxococcales bacterium]|nr:VWA domain-containing protein [Myxococcales bacterium]
MRAPCPTRWRPSRPRPAAGLVAAAMAACLVPACSDVGDVARYVAPATPEAEQIVDEIAPNDESALESRARLAESMPEGLRALGYADADAAAPRPTGTPQEAGAGAVNSEALSELEYQTAQSLNQRANEAFDYLGVQDFAAPDAPVGGKSRQAPAAGPMRFVDIGRLVDRRDAPEHFREENAAPALREKKAVGALVDQDELERAARIARRAGREPPDAAAPSPSPAQRFARERRSLESLRFQPSSGYWANTYVPGDPVMRWLESRLGEGDRAALQAFASRPLRLDAAARQTPQPFDPPHSAALSVFLQADRRGLEHEGRVLVQVGLQGARRRSGLRPAMSVGIVLDLRGAISTEVATAMRALLDGFLEAKDVGDRFSLTVAGRPGGTRVGADEFRHGPITVAMSRLIGPVDPGASPQPILGLEEAVRKTAAELQSGDDPAAPLGSSLVLLVTSQPFGPHTDALAATAHRSAVAGVPMSVVGIGDAVELAEIERVTLAGQGNRRLLHAAADAARLVERELSALARVIARAVRLRIRLAPGVRLVEVVGAERLDAAGAQRVRQAEKSIDRRLARNLGIESDRGEDEEGIQIVIPTFQSGDGHAVLLDVVASGPGPIADVTVRYKDLVYLRNSVARANLSLGRSADAPGPLERNVVKNYLAIRLADTLKRAGRSLLAGGDARAIAEVREFRALLASLQREVPGFQNDADLANDTGMLGEYLALLETGVLHQAEPRQVLADSLQLSGYFKTVPRSAVDPWNRRR